MGNCRNSGKPEAECICLECTYRRIVQRMIDNGYERGKAEIEARKPEMEQEMREQNEPGAADRGNG